MKSAHKGLAAGLERTLGVAQSEIQAEAEEAPAGPAKGSVEIGHGTTVAGGDYTVWLEPKPGSSPQAPRCRLSMEVLETEAESNSTKPSEIDGTGVNEVCLSRSNPRTPSVQCRNAGLLTIEAQTLPTCSHRAPKPQRWPADQLARSDHTGESRRARRFLLPGCARPLADPRHAHRTRRARQCAADRKAAAYRQVRSAVAEAPTRRQPHNRARQPAAGAELLDHRRTLQLHK